MDRDLSRLLSYPLFLDPDCSDLKAALLRAAQKSSLVL